MSKPRKKKKSPKRVLGLPDLAQAKSAVLNTLTSVSGQRTYDHAINGFVEWYCGCYETRQESPGVRPTTTMRDTAVMAYNPIPRPAPHAEHG